MDGTDINSVDRSPGCNLLATADDFGKVNIYQYPAICETGSQHSSYSGHSSHVTSLKWVVNQRFISIILLNTSKYNLVFKGYIFNKHGWRR
jgi:hypothetical protein